MSTDYSAVQTPLPTPVHGIHWRPLHCDDAAPLAALVARIEARDNPPYRTSAAEVAEMLDPNTQWVGAVALADVGVHRGQMVAFTHMELREGARTEALCQGGVDPHFRRLGIGQSIVHWQTDTGRELLSASPANGGSVVMSVDPNHEELEIHLKSSGYRWSRSYSEMRADLRRIPTLPANEPYVVLEPWSEQWDDAVRQAVSAAAIRGGGEALSPEDWQKGRSAFCEGWSVVAYDSRGDRPRIVGFLMASRYEQDWAALGWREGYIDQLTVFEDWRHSGIAEALVVASMRAQKRDGMERAGTGVSSDHHADAYSVFDFLGFREVGQIRLYTLNV